MNINADKTTENKSRAVANSLIKQQYSSKSAGGLVDNRPVAITQRKFQKAINNSPHAQRLKAYQEMADSSRVMPGSKPAQKERVFPFVPQGSKTIQRLIAGYQPGKLRKNTIVMRGLTEEQMDIVQALHDDEDDNVYSVEDARAQAIEEAPNAADNDDEEDDEDDAPNPYNWEVLKKAAFTSADVSIQSIVNNFGHPTPAVTKIYMDLGERIGDEVNGSPANPLSKGLVDEIYQLLDAQMPLHFGDNPFLEAAWQNNLEAYKGQKTGKQLYAVLRSKLTGELREIIDSVGDFNEILQTISGRPPEAHHYLYKAIYGEDAANKLNLGLVGRSEREREFGPGQHELMHYVASGGSDNKFKVLTQQFVDAYNQWVKDRYGEWLLKPIV